MSTRFLYGLLAILGLLGFGILMALRTEPSSFAARIGVAVLAGICLGAALICLRKARSM